MQSIKTSELRHRVTIQIENGVERDEHNQPIPKWETFKTLWGKVEWLSGREFWVAQQINNEINGKITVRHTKGLKPSMRVIYDGRIFEIIAPIPDERKVFLQLLVKELL